MECVEKVDLERAMAEPSDKANVLIVDGDDPVRTALEAELTSIGFHIQTASTAGECLEKVHRNNVDLVLLDIVMLESEGLTTLRTIHDQYPDFPVIVHSSFGSLEAVLDALHAGASDYLAKPSLAVEIAHRIEKVLESERTRRLAKSAERFQTKLRSSQTLAGGLAHDLNNHLTVIIASTRQVLAGLSPGQSDHADLSGVLDSAKVIADVSNKLLSYAGAGHFEMVPVDLCALVPDLVESICAELGDDVLGAAQVDVQTLSQPLPVMADMKELGIVLERLIVNATEAAVGDRPVNIEIKICRRLVGEELLKEHHGIAGLSAGEFACIRVSDDGAGMDPDTLSNVFDPFFSTKFAGRGLGMPSVLGILNGHGGGVLVNSTVGTGTSVEGLIPVATVKEDLHTALHTRVEVPQSRAPAGDAPHGRIMVIDDESMVRQLTGRALAKSGHTVESFNNGPAGIDRFRHCPQEFDLVILDLCMPGMDGHEVLRELRTIDPNVKVLLTSGYHSSEVANRFEDERPNGFIPKPYPIEELREKVAAVLQS